MAFDQPRKEIFMITTGVSIGIGEATTIQLNMICFTVFAGIRLDESDVLDRFFNMSSTDLS